MKVKSKYVIVIRTNSNGANIAQADTYINTLKDNIRASLKNDKIPVISYDARFVEFVEVMELPIND